MKYIEIVFILLMLTSVITYLELIIATIEAILIKNRLKPDQINASIYERKPYENRNSG